MLLDISHEILYNPANLIAAVSSVAALTTALIALFAIRETQRQRRTTYRPDLYLETTSAQLISPEFGNSFSSVKFQQEHRVAPADAPKQKPEMEVSYDSEKYLIPQSWMIAHFFNIGLGAAKEIKYEWDYDEGMFLDLISKYANPSQIEIIAMDIDSTFNYHISIPALSYSLYLSKSDLLKKGSTDVIRANSTPVMQTQLMICDPYLKLLTTYIIAKYNLIMNVNSDFLHDEFAEIPPLTLLVTYKDIEKKKFRKRISVNFTFYSSTTKKRPRPALSTVQQIEFGTLFTRIAEIN